MTRWRYSARMGNRILASAIVLAFASRAMAAPDPATDPAGSPPGVLVIPAPIGEPLPESGVESMPPPGNVEVLTQPEQLAEAPMYSLRRARWRLAGVQGANAAGLTAGICGMLATETRTDRCAPFPVILGGAAALAAGLAVRPGISSDHVSAINGGTALAVWHGMLIMGMTGMYWNVDETGRQVGGISILTASQAIGPIAGHFFYRLRPSRQGVVDAAVVSSLWGGLFASMLFAGYADPTLADSNHPAQFGTILLATEAGMGLGVLLGRNTHFSPLRALAIHGYAISGGMFGILVGLPVMKARLDRDIGEDDFWRAVAFGSLGGFAVGVASTRHLGERGNATMPIASFGFQPTPGGGVASLNGRF